MPALTSRRTPFRLAFLKVLGVDFRHMPSAEFLFDKLGTYAERFEEVFETRFERLARDPRVLAFVGSSLNFASAMRIETRKIEVEVASFRARAKLAMRKIQKVKS
jgi:pantoate kinase